MPKINFYKYNGDFGVIEVFIECEFRLIKNQLHKFCIIDKEIASENWQTLYMEQYYSADRKGKICDIYDEPDITISNFYLVFFMYSLQVGQTLQTPYGEVTVSDLYELPSEYRNNIVFEDLD